MHALITGASAGIGAALARAFGSAGYDLTLVSRRKDVLDEVAASVKGGNKVNVVPFDLTQIDRIGDLIMETVAHGEVDVLINNAGMEHVSSSATIDVELMERMVTLNLRMPIRLTRMFLPTMIKRGSGSIVDVCSVAAFNHPPYQSLYSATKAGLAAFSTSLRAELRKTGVHVMTVYPGPIKTRMGVAAAEATTAPANVVPWGTAEGVADRVLRGVRRKKKQVIYPRFYGFLKTFRGIAQTVLDAQSYELTGK